MARTVTLPSVASGPLIAFLVLLAGAMAVRSPELAVTGALLVLLVAVRNESRTGGLLLLWSYWLLMPFVRRIVELVAEGGGPDPLSVLPFAATALLALMELRENRLSRHARTVLALATGGIVIGLPVGFVTDPAPAMFAVTAYLAGLSGLVIGWGDQIRPEVGPTLERVLRVALVPIALYAIAQYFFSLTSWDSNWVAASELASLEAPQKGHVRVFSTLNSPFTFAIVLCVGLIFAFAARRGAMRSALYILPVVVALGLTFVRSAWLSLVVGLIVYAAAARGRAAGKTVGVILVCLAAVVLVGSSNPTTKAFTERVTSLGDPESDRSARERLETTGTLLPESVSRPLGAGLGQAGQAVSLSESKESGVETVDNGYISLLFQSGPVGFALLLFAIGSCVGAAIRTLGRAPPQERQWRAAILGVLAMLLVAEASGDVLFGLPGVIFWYLGGISLAGLTERRARYRGEAVPINGAEERAAFS